MSETFVAVSSDPRKPHLLALDGLRGVAAVGVLLLHWFDGNGLDPFHYSLMAVDFFFMLSGFVIGYSYDDRLRDGMPLRDFFISRIIRLYPMICLGVLLGLGREILHSNLVGTPHYLIDLIGMTLQNLFLVPVIDGHANMALFTLNIALWSLSFECLAYILYVTIYIRAGNWLLGLTVLAAVPGVMGWICNTFHPMSGIFAIPLFEGTFLQNLARLIFAYFLGLWLFRNRDRLKFIPALSFPCLGILCAPLFSLPNLPAALEVNFLILAIGFPVIIMSASREVMSGAWAKAGALLGEISYPLYLTHLPVIWTEGAMLKHVFPHVSPILFGFVTVPTAIAFAYVSLKTYDEPVRAFCKRMLTKKALRKSGREVVKCAESIR